MYLLWRVFFNDYLFGQAFYAPTWQVHFADAYQNGMAVFTIWIFYVLLVLAWSDLFYIAF